MARLDQVDDLFSAQHWFEEWETIEESKKDEILELKDHLLTDNFFLSWPLFALIFLRLFFFSLIPDKKIQQEKEGECVSVFARARECAREMS